MLGITWSDVTVAGAFLAGITIGAFITKAIVGYVMQYMRKEGKQDDKPN